jgi:hypothetical protein
MSLPVDLEALRDRIAEYGTTAFLVTADHQGAAHVVSVMLRGVGDDLVVPVGRRSRANLERSHQATLLWPPGPDPAYSLIVDAAADTDDGEEDEVRLTPHSAVLHRMAGATGDGPYCLPVDEPGPAA